MEFNFTGKRAIVTGAGSGIGRHIATALYHSGAKTYAVSLLQAELDLLKEECPDIITVCVDLSDWKATQQAISCIGPMDILVNNAGVAPFVSFLDTMEDDFDTTFDVNVKGILAVTQAVAREMVKHNIKGCIVNLSSTFAERGIGYAAYSASKGAVQQLTRCMAIELGPHQIRINAIKPTTVHGSGLGDASIAKLPKLIENIVEATPLRRLAQLDDVTNAALYLLSDKADMINGAFLPVDGGLLCA